MDFKHFWMYFKRGIVFAILGLIVSTIFGMIFGTSALANIDVITSNPISIIGMLGLFFLVIYIVDGWLMTQIVTKWIKK